MFVDEFLGLGRVAQSAGLLFEFVCGIEGEGEPGVGGEILDDFGDGGGGRFAIERVGADGRTAGSRWRWTARHDITLGNWWKEC